LETNKGEGSESKKRHKKTSEDMVRGGTPLRTPKREKNNHDQISSATTKTRRYY